MELISEPAASRSRNLVFTSAGDRSNLSCWLKGRRDFDLWIVYYGDRPDAFRGQSEFYLRRKGSKFQNLHYCYQHRKDIFARYDAVMVIDDDILIDATGLSKLFDVRRERDLWLLQPAFRLSGKISWDITRVRPTMKIRYTNFVEMACPLFRQDKLEAFMAAYDSELVGYGIDWWYLKTLGKDLGGHVAIVDEVTCVNPYDRSKGGMREIDRLQSRAKREEVWERVRARYELARWEQRESGHVDQSLSGATAAVVKYLHDWLGLYGRVFAKRLVRTFLPRSGANESA